MMMGNRKEEGRVFTVLLNVTRKSLTPCENRLTAILNRKKAQVQTRIQTRPAQIECHRSATCAATTSQLANFLKNQAAWCNEH